MDIDVRRSADRSANVTSRIVAPGVGYIRIAEFDETTPDAIESAAEALGGQGATKLVVDLRGTAIGAFETGIASAALFTDADTLVIRETSATQQPVARRAAPASIAVPVVLLTNPGTAGAAEVFAAALIDTERAETVGLRTAGRAAEQTLVDLPGGGGLLLSSTRYLAPSGAAIHRVGTATDGSTPTPRTELGEPRPNPDEDPVLDRALEHLTAMPTV
jgi:carboxyl-terminal processing protease